MVQVVTGDSQEEVIIFRDRQTDRQTHHHNIYIVITIIVIIIKSLTLSFASSLCKNTCAAFSPTKKLPHVQESKCLTKPTWTDADENKYSIRKGCKKEI